LVEAIRKISEEILCVYAENGGIYFQQLGGKEIKKGNPLFPRIETKKK